MTASIKQGNREVLPRWRSFIEATLLGELAIPLEGGEPRGLPGNPEIEEKQHAFALLPGIASASDLVGAAFVSRQRDIADGAARFLLTSERASPISRRIAERVLHPDRHDIARVLTETDLDRRRISVRVRGLRRRVRQNPRNPIAWVDLAREYTLLAELSQAERAMNVALTLAPNNRFVLRSATRLFVHTGDPTRAHDIVARSERTSSDPWLMATEIASAAVAQRSPRFVKSGMRTLDRSFPADHLTELASALGTAELHSGSGKRARRLFERSREGANENTRAQMEWASRNGVRIELTDDELTDAFEAQSSRFKEAGEWGEAVGAAVKWHLQEPFASQPLVFASYVAAVGLRDFALSADLAKRGLEANPDDVTLLNNAAFALLQINESDAAERLVEHARKLTDDAARPALMATRGLLAYRRGQVDEARSLYRKAMTFADPKPQPDFVVLSLIMAAREEMRIYGSASEVPIADEARQLATKIAKNPAVDQWLSELGEG